MSTGWVKIRCEYSRIWSILIATTSPTIYRHWRINSISDMNLEVQLMSRHLFKGMYSALPVKEMFYGSLVFSLLLCFMETCCLSYAWYSLQDPHCLWLLYLSRLISDLSPLARSTPAICLPISQVPQDLFHLGTFKHSFSTVMEHVNAAYASPLKYLLWTNKNVWLDLSF